MKGLLNFKPILKDIVVHATLDDFGQIMLVSKSVLNWFSKNEDNVLTELKCALNDITYGEFQDVKYKTKRICIWAMRFEPTDLRYVENQTYKICYEAVSRNGLALQFVKNQNEDICYEALANNIESIHYVKDKNDEIRAYVSYIIDTLKFSNEGSPEF